MTDDSTLRACDGRDALLRAAVSRVPVLPIFTPNNFAREVARLEAALRTNRTCEISFAYDREPPDCASLVAHLERLANEWHEHDALGALYADKAREVALEARMCAARHEDVARYAAERFAAPSVALDADALAREWIHEAKDALETASYVVSSDDEGEPRSLVRRMRAVIGERRLPYRVLIARSLAPLAAVGDGIVQIAPARELTDVDVERTVLHEIDGHIVPATRATTSPLGLLRIGTARGSDHQEGWALVLEERGGFLRAARRLELGVRHLASRAAHAGRPLTDIAEELALECGDPSLVARSVCRAYRGGGLGREAAYLPALVAVRRALAADPTLEAVLTSGRVSLEAALILRGHAAQWLPGPAVRSSAL